MKLQLLLVGTAIVAFAQSRITLHYTAPLPECDAVVVGDMTGGTVREVGHDIAVDAVLHVQRVLKGHIASGSDVRVGWQYTPNPFEGPAVITQVPHLRALWFLRLTGEPDRLTPVPRNIISAYDDPYLPLPLEDLPTDLTYAAGDSIDTKLSRELAFAMIRTADQGKEKLNVARVRGPSGTTMIQGSEAGSRFHQLAALFWRLKPEDAKPISERFSASPLPNLRTMGLAGLLRLGDANAVLALERDVVELAPTHEADQLATALDERRLSPSPNIVQALGRAALSETEIPEFEPAVARVIAVKHQIDGLPYLAAMLDSPDEKTRGEAVYGFCWILEPQWPVLHQIPDPMPHCPGAYPFGKDGDLVQSWREWWRDHRKDTEFSSLPVVEAPARYREQ